MGSFSLGQDKRGDLKVGLNQAANILGFGGDRGLDFTIGEGRFDTKARHGALIAGERIGLDSGFGLNEAEGLNFGSFLNFGKNPLSINNPAGQFLSFLENITKFFTSGGKSLEPLPSPLQPNIQTENDFRNFGTKLRKISGNTMNDMQSENVNDGDYYRDVGINFQ
uniref:Uncharacterized protein n=1 Tax=Onchocerca volvulus TaxID=6282 RepID=A0A8R1TIY5_ONCVO